MFFATFWPNKFLVDLEHQTINYQLKGEDGMASIEKTEHVNSVNLW